MNREVFESTAHEFLSSRPPITTLYTDLDGTLLGQNGSLVHDHEGVPSTVTATALVSAQKAGISVVAVTGRKASSLIQELPVMGIRHGIGEAGSVIVQGRTVTMAWGDAPRDLGETPRQALLNSGALDAVLNAPGCEVQLYEPWDEGRIGGYLLRGVMDETLGAATLKKAGITWARVIDNGPVHDDSASSKARTYHLLPNGVGKAHAVSDDLHRRGIPVDAAVAIGDSPEDATMASSVGVYVHVGDCQDVLLGNDPDQHIICGGRFAWLVDAVVRHNETA